MAHLIAILHIHHPTVHSPPVHVDNRPQLALTCEHVATNGSRDRAAIKGIEDITMLSANRMKCSVMSLLNKSGSSINAELEAELSLSLLLTLLTYFIINILLML